jgi:restriction system protein
MMLNKSDAIDRMPSYEELMNPLLAALHELGGSGSIDEIYEKVVDLLGLPEEILVKLHNSEAGNTTEIEYRLAWARTYLKKYGILENSGRGVWAISQNKAHVGEVDAREVARFVRNINREQRSAHQNQANQANDVLDPQEEESIEVPAEVQTWRTLLHAILKQLDPTAFERLIKRVLRESGFVQVDVTGRSGDGGIDGRGIARIHGFLSFHVIFQCKRYQGAVTSGQIRDFRGAMVGRADKGLFATTGTFTRDAHKEATRDGAPPIDLIDGDQLVDKLKELALGVKTEIVEKVIVDEEWYRNV